jgi:hypothetical protein
LEVGVQIQSESHKIVGELRMKETLHNFLEVGVKLRQWLEQRRRRRVGEDRRSATVQVEQRRSKVERRRSKTRLLQA